eukprot:CAMPEP_0179240118 /NCGR_PEP_ID=MMETSP0797-20121207/15810_1 /TAXON_ID=47934 /ORGANISM="Dinophysis acuminata, Strain DAEP01" /LENGTH=75 /DNA_ID=CAMNT_0020947459 /DNA_START=394 /DNA_END=621 /DNA_ORIENTATION=-
MSDVTANPMHERWWSVVPTNFATASSSCTCAGGTKEESVRRHFQLSDVTSKHMQERRWSVVPTYGGHQRWPIKGT